MTNQFLSYFRRYTVFHGKQLSLTAGVLFGAYFAFLGLDLMTSHFLYYHGGNPPGIDPMWSFEINLAIFFLVVLGAVAGSIFYLPYSKKNNRLETLTLPVSGPVKFWTYFIYCFLGVWIAVLATVFVADFFRVLLLRGLLDVGDKALFLPFDRFLSFNSDLPLNPSGLFEVAIFYIIIVIVQALYAVGSIFLPKQSFIKTAVALWILSSLCGLLVWLGTLAFFGQSNIAPVDGEIDSWASPFLLIAAGVIISGLLYALSYWRMKETESVDRW